MSNKLLIVVAVILVALGIVALVKDKVALGKGLTSDSISSETVATSTLMSVPLGLDARVLATTTNRSYAAIHNGCGAEIEVILSDAEADHGIVVADNGVFEIDGDNLYTGSIRATSSAACSSLIHVYELVQ
jgi:hypothetical protein